MALKKPTLDCSSACFLLQKNPPTWFTALNRFSKGLMTLEPMQGQLAAQPGTVLGIGWQGWLGWGLQDLHTPVQTSLPGCLLLTVLLKQLQGSRPPGQPSAGCTLQGTACTVHGAGYRVLSSLCTAGMLRRVYTQGTAVLVGRELGFWEAQAEGFAFRAAPRAAQCPPAASRAIKVVPPAALAHTRLCCMAQCGCSLTPSPALL